MSEQPACHRCHCVMEVTIDDRWYCPHCGDCDPKDIARERMSDNDKSSPRDRSGSDSELTTTSTTTEYEGMSVTAYSIGEVFPRDPFEPLREQERPKTLTSDSLTFRPAEPTQLELHVKAYHMACDLAESQQRTIDAMERTIAAQAKSIETLERMLRMDMDEDQEDEPNIE